MVTPRRLLVQLGRGVMAEAVREDVLAGRGVVDELKTFSLREVFASMENPGIGCWMGFWMTLGEETLRRVDAVICYAGLLRPQYWAAATTHDIDDMLQFNFLHPLYGLLAFAGLRSQEKYPVPCTWVFTNTQAVGVGDDENFLYVGAKSCLLGATRSIGRELWNDSKIAVVHAMLPLCKPSRMYDVWVNHIAEQEGVTLVDAERMLAGRLKSPAFATPDEVASALMGILGMPSAMVANAVIDLKHGAKGGIGSWV